jgi:hypothetical protein
MYRLEKWQFRSIVVAATAAILSMSTFCRGAVREWDMSVGGPFMLDASWYEPSRWTGNAVPTAIDDVIFGGPLPFDHPTIVQFYDFNANPGFPAAQANSLVADSADSPDPALSVLSLQLGNSSAPFAGSLSVHAAAFDVGTRFNSTANLNAHRWDIAHTSVAHPLRVARHGARAGIDLIEADLSVAFRLEIARGSGGPLNTASLGTVNVVGSAEHASTVTIADRAVVGVAGGDGAMTLGDYTQTTIGGLLAVGSGAPLSSTGVLQSRGRFGLFGSFDASATLDVANELLVGVDSGFGEATIIGDLTVGTDASGSSFVVGRGVVDDMPNHRAVRANGSIGLQGTSHADGNGFVAIDGAIGSIGWGSGGHTLLGDLVVADRGFESAIDGYVPSQGSAGIGLNTNVSVADLFIGNNKSIGEFFADPSGDGGASLNANYVSVGELGTGFLRVGGMLNAEFDHLEIKLASGTQTFEQGGRVQLGSGGGSDSARLSVRRLSARGEGDRFEWQSDTLELRDGVIDDWGVAQFLVPETGRFTGAGTANVVLFRNQGTLSIGFESGLPTYDDSLVVTGDFNNDGGDIYLDASRPTRFGNFDETLIVQGNAAFDGGEIFLNIIDVIDSGYNWYADILPSDTFNFFDFSSTSQPVDLSSVTLYLPFLPAAYEWNTTLLPTQGVIFVQVVPEPTTALAGVAVVVAAGLSRRRRISPSTHSRFQ